MSKQSPTRKSGKIYNSAFNQKSQWDGWGETEWLMFYIGQVWAIQHQFPTNQTELDAIDLEAIRADYERSKKENLEIVIRGTTLEESWIAASIMTKQFQVYLRNGLQYWPPDKIPQQFKKNLSPYSIWRYIYCSTELFYERLGLPATPPRPFGPLGVFLGNCAHSVTVIGIDRHEERLLFKDSWEKGERISLLAEGQNALGIKAIRENKNTWSITKEEFEKSVLCFLTTKVSYDYYSKLVTDNMFQIRLNKA